MAKFELGQLLATPGALKAAEASGDSLAKYINRHATGEWGTVDSEDKRANNQALKDGTRVFSAYIMKGGTKIWIITEADRSATTVLLPEEY